MKITEENIYTRIYYVSIENGEIPSNILPMIRNKLQSEGFQITEMRGRDWKEFVYVGKKCLEPRENHQSSFRS